MIIKAHYNPLRSPEPETLGGGSIAQREGLSSRMDEFLKTPDPNPDPQPLAALDPPFNQDPPKPEDKPEDKPDDEIEFPQIGAIPTPETIVPVPESFDEAAFDATTEAETKGMAHKAREEFKRLKGELKAKIKENIEIKAAVVKKEPPPEVRTELEALRTTALEVEALRQRNKELLQINDEVAVTESPEFITKVKRPLDEMKSVVAQMAELGKVDVDTLRSIILEPNVAKQDLAIEEIEDSLGKRQASRLARLADDYKAIMAAQEEMFSNAPTVLANARSQKEQAALAEKQASVASYRSAVEDSFRQYSRTIPGFTDTAGQLTDLAKSVMAASVSVDPNTLAPNDLGFMMFAVKSLPEARKTIKALREEISILKGSRPASTITSGTTPTPVPAPAATDDKRGLMASMAGKEFTFTPP